MAKGISDLTDRVDALVQAYNAHDALSFSKFFAVDAQTFEHPNVLAQSSREEIFQTYQRVFQLAPLNRTTVMHRIVIGTRVIDHERVQRSPEAEPLEAIAIYQFNDGLISRFDLIRDVPPLVK
jgi:hypothetical protein